MIDSAGQRIISKLRSYLRTSKKPRESTEESASLSAYILDFSSQSQEAHAYATTHIGRLVRTLELTPTGGPSDRVLEMGAYMQITPALKTILGYGEVRGSYLGPLGRVDEKVAVSRSGEEFRCQIDLFNAEKDRYPYDDRSFATVLCCELLEHLSEDPMFLLAEVNRILRPGGVIVLSTPNICSLRAIASILLGGHPGLYQQFIRARDGAVDPRHAREYAPSEIRMALESAGFNVEAIETGPYGAAVNSDSLEWVTKLLEQHGFSLDLRGETIHVVGRKTGEVQERFPKWLYD